MYVDQFEDAKKANQKLNTAMSKQAKVGGKGSSRKKIESRVGKAL